MPRTKKILTAEEAQEKIEKRRKVVAKYTAKPRSKELASARYEKYQNDPDSTYNKPREGDAYERQQRDKKKYYLKKKEQKSLLKN